MWESGSRRDECNEMRSTVGGHHTKWYGRRSSTAPLISLVPGTSPPVMQGSIHRCQCIELGFKQSPLSSLRYGIEQMIQLSRVREVVAILASFEATDQAVSGSLTLMSRWWSEIPTRIIEGGVGTSVSRPDTP